MNDDNNKPDNVSGPASHVPSDQELDDLVSAVRGSLVRINEYGDALTAWDADWSW